MQQFCGELQQLHAHRVEVLHLTAVLKVMSFLQIELPWDPSC